MGKIVYFKKIDWDNQSKTLFRIPKDKLLAGVNQFTLFDEEGRIYAERLAFIHPANEINITCTLDKEKYEDREAVEIDFKLTDKKGQPIETTFSLSVRDANKDTPVNNYSSNIKSNLLLSSDLKGFIENVDYYIESDDLAHRSALDLLLTTQGWRRYDWKQITRPQDFKVNHPIEEGIMVIGELKSTMRKRVKAGAEIKIWIMNDEGSYQKGSCFTDSLGKFAFVSEDFEGRWKMNIQTKEKNKQKEMRINLDKAFSPQPRANTSTETTLFEKQKKYIVNNKEDKQSSSNDISHEWENLLPIVEVNADKIWNSKFIMKWNNIIYDIDNERDRMDDTGENYLQPFYEWLEKNNSYFHYNLLDTLTATYKGKQVYFLSHRGDASAKLDDDAGVNIDLEQLTINDLDAISISDKPLAIRALRPAFFRVIKNVTISDSISQLVVISLFIKKEYFAQRDKKGERFSQLQGYSQVRQFYVSDHSDSALPNENKYQRTLYWNPNIRTNANGEAMIKFRNTESCRNMKINAETVMDTGLFGSLNSFLPCY